MNPDLIKIYATHSFALEYAGELLHFSQFNSSKLSLGKKIFIIQAAQDALSIPYQYRSREVDSLLKHMLAIGVCDFNSFPRGVDAVVDYFYEHPDDAGKEFLNF